MSDLSPTRFKTLDYSTFFWKQSLNSNWEKLNTYMNKCNLLWDGTATNGKGIKWDSTNNKWVVSAITHSEVALTDADATLTAAQMENDGIFTITPTAARTLTTDTAANLVAGFTGAAVGDWFEFTIVDLAAYDVTLAAGVGITLTGNAVVNNSSATFLATFTNVTSGTEAVTIYRK